MQWNYHILAILCQTMYRPGHSNFNTTANIYVQLDTKVKQKLADVLSNILRSQKNISILKRS
mgnify:CR=1 FL=1